MKKGFTLIEFLVVVAIIGVLASIVLSSLSEARNKARDASRITTMKQLEVALELFYADHDRYPIVSDRGINNSDYSGFGHDTADALQFISDIEPYLKNFDANELLLGDDTRYGSFYYQSHSSNNYQSYGAMLDLIDNNHPVGKLDGGYFPSSETGYSHTNGHAQNSFEIGLGPRYCREKYFDSWVSNNRRCTSGN